MMHVMKYLHAWPQEHLGRSRSLAVRIQIVAALGIMFLVNMTQYQFRYDIQASPSSHVAVHYNYS